MEMKQIDHDDDPSQGPSEAAVVGPTAAVFNAPMSDGGLHSELQSLLRVQRAEVSIIEEFFDGEDGQ